MILTLRPSQEAALCSLWGYFEQSSGSPIVVLPTAAGKSVVIASWIQGVMSEYPDSGFLVLSHVAELLSQNMSELLAIWPDAPCGIYSASLGRKDIAAQVLFAGIASIHRKAYAIPRRIDFILIDECHLVSNKASGMYRAFLAELLVCNPYVKVVGFSATPYRLGAGLLTDGDDALFTDIAYEAGILPLVEAGYLSPLITTPTSTKFDLSGVGTVAGDYNQVQLERAVDVDETTAAAVQEIVAHGADRRSWLVFCAGVAHAEHVAAAIRGHGISAATITGETDKAERARLLEDFKAGRLRCLTNNNVLTTGINVRGIDLLAFLRPSKSVALYVQMAGRGMRLSPETGKTNCLVLDFARLIETHGPVDQVKVKPKKGTGPAPVKECQSCFAHVFASARVCPNCGCDFPPPIEEVKITSKAAKAAILSTQKVDPEWCDVHNVTYRPHQKPGGTPTLRVDYMCGFARHSEWVCFEHAGFPRQKAVQWWQRRAPAMPVPNSVDEALAQTHTLSKPARIFVRPSGKYTEIVGMSFEPCVIPSSTTLSLPASSTLSPAPSPH
ncbi:MAG: hypothetical protein NVS1B6_16810 [Steroidobacteraceae bacterium]